MTFETGVGPLGNAALVGTITVSGTLTSVNYISTIGTVAYVATVGLNSNVQGTVTVGSLAPVLYASGSSSATIDSTGGNLWAIEWNDTATGLVGTASATLLLLNYGAAAASGTIMSMMQAGGKNFASFTPARPKAYATLVASVLGTGFYTISYKT